MTLAQYKHLVTSKFENHYDNYENEAVEFAKQHQGKLYEFDTHEKFKGIRDAYNSHKYNTYYELLKLCNEQAYGEKDWLGALKHLNKLENELTKDLMRKEEDLLATDIN